MLVADFLLWWYTRGWHLFTRALFEKLRSMADFFSMSLLLRTLFAPFKQISTADVTRGGPAAYLANFFDKLLSRVIGMFVRLFILMFGSIVLTLETIFSVLFIAIWPVVPILPAVCVALCIMGVTL